MLQQVIPGILRGQTQVSGPVTGLRAGIALPAAHPAYGALPRGCLALWKDFSPSGLSLTQLARGLAAALKWDCRTIWDYQNLTCSQIVVLIYLI